MTTEQLQFQAEITRLFVALGYAFNGINHPAWKDFTKFMWPGLEEALPSADAME